MWEPGCSDVLFGTYLYRNMRTYQVTILLIIPISTQISEFDW